MGFESRSRTKISGRIPHDPCWVPDSIPCPSDRISTSRTTRPKLAQCPKSSALLYMYKCYFQGEAKCYFLLAALLPPRCDRLCMLWQLAACQRTRGCWDAVLKRSHLYTRKFLLSLIPPPEDQGKGWWRLGCTPARPEVLIDTPG